MENDLIAIGRETIRREAQALAALVDTIDASFARAAELLFGCKGTVILTGMGKSGLVARKWASTFASTGTKAYFLDPAEASHGDLGLLHPDDVLVALSMSGETEELGVVLRHARETGVRAVGVTGNRSSSLARQTEVLLCVSPAPEACPLGLAPTTSTTLMMAIGDALASALMKLRGFTERDFARLHPGGSLGRRLWLRVSELMHSGSQIPVVAPDDSLELLLVEMTRKRLGLAVVMVGTVVAGIVTDGDLRRFFQRAPADRGAHARDLMTRDPKRIAPDALAVEARETLERFSIQHLLVMDGAGALVGVVHLQDLLRAKVV
ncbi:MAG: KpsF/GutQ family sugar-phosphate isomerase [Verrucomicrobia bacterium]|nr:MAG: KpsF/GutQ family sugar-phosphate isomerase [Verrucomicrobiota bacterium]